VDFGCETTSQIFGSGRGSGGEALLHLGALGHYGLYEENGEFAEVFDLSTFVSNFLAIFFTAFFTAFFVAFFAAFFAAFFTTLDFLVFLAIL
jgi:hypothetical protein